jgi:hypothetical protein
MDTDYYLVTIELPDAPIFKPSFEELPSNWMVTPPLASVQAYGASVLKDGLWLGFEIPSVILPIESNIVLDVYHPMYSKIKIISVSLLNPDPRLLP